MSRLRKWDERRLCHEFGRGSNHERVHVYRAINKSCDRVFAYNLNVEPRAARALGRGVEYFQLLPPDTLTSYQL